MKLVLTLFAIISHIVFAQSAQPIIKEGSTSTLKSSGL
jgi:hypothetical protein